MGTQSNISEAFADKVIWITGASSGIGEGTDEIIVAAEGETQLLKMKREDPVAVFRTMEAAAEQEIYADE